jgi:hypothetical protein
MASRASALEPSVSPTSPDVSSTPEDDEGHSGRLLLRMPQSLHGELARAAEREHVSLNAYITSALSATVHWHADDRAPRADRPQASASLPRLLRIAIVADLVLVAVAACAAIALLIVAL